MDPSVVVAHQPPKPSKLSKLSRFLIPGAVILAVIIGAVYLIPKLIPQAQKTIIKTSKTNPQSPTLKLQKAINQTFGGQAKYQEIVKLTNLATSEKDISNKYQDYKLIFAKSLKAYQQTKDPQKLFVLYQIRNYTIAFPNYKEGDFKIPK